MKPRIVYIHGNDTEYWSFGYARWLKKELEKKSFPTFFETFPDSILARAKYWLPFLKNYIKAGEKDVIVGWSSGAEAAMRYAEESKILGSVLVSPCYTDLNDEGEKQSGYYDKPWNWEAIKKNQKNIAIFYGNNDPYIPQSEFKFIADKLDAEVFKIKGSGHFTKYNKFSKLLAYIVKNYK